MLKAIARIQTAVAIAQGNGDTAALSAFQAAIAAITPFAVSPYILPDVLTPADVPAAPVPTSIQEAHDMVQAGVITREDAVDSGVIQTVDQLPPHPDEVAPGAADPTPPSDDPAHDAPANSVSNPVIPPASDAGASGASDSGMAAGVPSDTTPAAPVQPDPVTPPPESAQTGEPSNASVPQAGSDVATQVTENPGPVDAPRSEADAANQGAVAGSVSQADPGDEDPTPPEKETIASLDKRIDQLERPGGKVSRQ